MMIIKSTSPALTVKAIFSDFYGTLVHEDGAVIKRITKEIAEPGTTDNTSEIGGFWWREFQSSLEKSFGDNFKTQRELEFQSLRKTIEHFHSTADAGILSELMFDFWVKPPAFEDSKPFFEQCGLPVYIVSNIDRQDVCRAVEYHGFTPAGIFTSEDARAYKPRSEIFLLALESTGLKPHEVIHIGDSLSSDVAGAQAVGIRALWLNRNSREVPHGVLSVKSLTEALAELNAE
ncbi:MAG: HAD family hydrolase [Oscillospiraceae bacterium]|nr:HAD family hydrolase [Oscillospiraceae bacterium]